MYAYRTRQVALRDGHFSRWCHLAKNVYDRANYIVRQEFFASGRCIGHCELYHLVKHDADYRALPALVANEVLRTLHEAWRAFLASDRSYGRDPSRFFSRPRPPRYKGHDGEITIRFPRPHLSQRKGAVVLPRAPRAARGHRGRDGAHRAPGGDVRGGGGLQEGARRALCQGRANTRCRHRT